jgi:hypothetical protein
VLLVPVGWEFWYYAIHNMGKAMAVPIGSYMMGIVSPTVLVLLAFVAVYFRDAMRNLVGEAKIFAGLLCCTATVLAVASFGRLSSDPFRQALDLATILALLVVLLVSAVAWQPKNRMVAVVLLLAIGFGLWHNLPSWFGYNSAITKADREAIAYANTLDVAEYNCSPQVAYWIYDRFTEAKYSGNASGLLIVRNLPMTPRSDPKNKWFDGHGIEPDGKYILNGIFRDNAVVVKVYRSIE